MVKKLVFFFTISLCLFGLSLSASAEEYLFTAKSDFPMTYSSSIEVVNARHGLYTAQSLEDIQYLIDSGIVDYYEPMTYSTLFDYEPSDKYYSEQNYLSQTLAQFAWDRKVFGESVKIAVIDSGIYRASPDLKSSNIIPVYDCFDTANSENTFALDQTGHGSQVAGIIAAQHNSNGIAGIAPDCTLYIFKCFGKDSEYSNDKILEAAYSAIDDYDVDIINMSFGTPSQKTFKAFVDYAAEKGVLIVAAAGNQGADGIGVYQYPAAYPSVLSVGSLGENGHTASHSQRNDAVNLLAPGENIYSVTTGGYDYGTGTSFAAPQVTAALALAKSINPSLTAPQLMDMAMITCDEMVDRYSGFGRLNIQALLTYAKATASNDLIYSINGSTVYFAYILPTGYKNYFATYEGDILSSVFTTDYDTFMKGDTAYLNSFRHFVWSENSLSPYEYSVGKSEYQSYY